MRVLFIGGTGIISSACAELALARGMELHLALRGKSESLRPIPAGAIVHRVDVRDEARAEAVLGALTFDAVVDFVAFDERDIERDVRLFTGRTNQFVFISSASAYRKPVSKLPIVESTPLFNPFWEYSRNKIACEDLLLHAFRTEGFPITIVRPSHTYDQTLLPFDPYGSETTVFSRIDRGLPVIVHGDGTSLWTLTHHADFAVGLVGLLGHPAAIGESFHITSDETLPWNEVFLSIARSMGRPLDIVHVPSDVIWAEHPTWGDSLLGDKAHSVMFDNTKIKRFVPEFSPTIPFWQGAREIVAFYRRRQDLVRVDAQVDALMDRLATRFR